MVGKRAKRTEKKEKKEHKKLKKILLKIFLVLVILGVIGVGVVFGVLFSLANGAWKLSKDSLEIEYRNSTIVDRNENVIGTLSGDESRIIVSKNEMSQYLPKAFISIEDERFETHKGIDLKRTLGATLKFITNSGTSSYGGSTITQQCIKNLTGEDEDSGFAGALRKVKEMVRAYQLEQIWSKDQIIELYLNLIPLGGDAHGVEVASIKYFNKSAKDLTLVESAYLAGITHAPSTYNPFGSKPYGQDETKTARVNKRVTDVCYKMHELGKINDEEYQAALQEIDAGIKFEQGNVTNNVKFSYHTEAAITQVVKELMKKNNWTEKEAETHLYGGGYTIYTTQDTELQNSVEEAYTNEKWIKTKKVKEENEQGEKVERTVQLQSGMAIMDHSTGYVIAGAGAIGEKTAWGTNRMVEAGHQPGSSMKPLAVVGPSLQEGLINAATVVDDVPVAYGSYTPKNDNWTYNGLMNIRYILRVSRNIPEVKMMTKLTVEKSAEYLRNMGIEVKGDEGLSLALGGTTHGITPLEMAGAYSTIANDGVYIEPTFYTKVVKSNGETLIEKKQETHRVFSEQNAWILQSLLTEPTGTGLSREGSPTGSGAAMKGYQTCGKTGTTDNKTYTWFCGFTPYYTGAMYFGYDNQKIGEKATSTIPGSGEVARRWKSIMTLAHEGLEAKKFEKPEGIVTAKVCSKSGLRATGLCGEAGCAYTEYFVSGTVPKGSCDTHVEAMTCEESGLLAGEHCPNSVRKVFITRDNRDSSKSWEKAADAKKMVPLGTCEVHLAPQIPTEPEVPEQQPDQPSGGGTEGEITTPEPPEQGGNEGGTITPEPPAEGGNEITTPEPPTEDGNETDIPVQAPEGEVTQ